MAYTTESKIYDRTGMSSSNIQTLSGKTETEVSTLISGFISDAENKIREDINYPIVIHNELHLGDGNKNIFKLGPRDEDYLTLGDYDPTDGLVKVYNAAFGGTRKQRPWPEDCDEWTENTSSDWTGSNVTITDESSIKKAGSYGLKMVFSASGNAYYPSTKDLDTIIDTYDDLFFWMRVSTLTPTITIRLYDKDGNYEEETISLRQAGVGQYIWLDIDELTDTIDWDDTPLQYVEVRANGACTIYLDNMCFADGWSFTAPEGLFHVSVADNISSETAPSENYPFSVTYGYDPFLASTPSYISEAAEWLCGIYIIDYLRGIRYRQTSFEVFGETLELDQDSSREGLLGVRTYMLKNYWRCLKNWGGASYGVV